MGYAYYLKDTLARQLIKRTGITLLTEEQTVDSLEKWQILKQSGSPVFLEEVRNVVDDKIIFSKIEQQLPNMYVYRYVNGNKKAALRSCGALLADKKIYNTDFSRVDIIRDFFKIDRRKEVNTELVIAPWHHYFGKSFIGYYDYMMYLAVKICRIKDTLSETDFAKALISYPLANTSYEREFLQLIGFDKNRIFDSSLTKIKFDECVLANSQDYTYPDKADIASLRRHMKASVTINNEKRARIYIVRAGRRKIIEEPALIEMLKKYDFKIIEDKPRTLAEQIALFNNAEFIIGPHGAAFANIIWCEPATHLFELFATNYAPIHFRYLSAMMGMKYSAYSREPIMHMSTAESISADISVSVSDIEAYLQKVFKKNINS